MQIWRCKNCGYIHQGEEPSTNCPLCGVDSENFSLVENIKSDMDTQLEKVLIVGNGAAGMEVASRIREKNKTVEITIFTEEPYHFYSRIHLSTFIGDNSSAEDITIYPKSWYEKNNIQVFLHTSIVKVSPLEKFVIDGTGKKHEYDKLIIATGAYPFVPPIQGVELKGVFTLRNLQDALRIKKFMKNCKDAVIIGGGILGIEAAASLNKNGLAVTVIELAGFIMPQQLNQEGAQALQKILEKRGINFRTSARVQIFEGESALKSILVNENEHIATQMAILSIGIIPNIGLAKEAGIQSNRGIVVNNNMQTNFKDIYAVGDVAEFNGTIFGIWPAAVDQGLVAADHILGLSPIYRGSLPLHILKVAGLELTTFGQKDIIHRNEHEVIYHNPAEDQFAKIIHDGEYILGAIILGIPGIGFRLERLLKKKKPIIDYLSYFEKGDWNILKQKK